MQHVSDRLKLRRTWPQRLFILFNSLVVLACFSAAAGLVYVDRKTGQIQRINLGHVLSNEADRASASAPLNVLLVGVDNAEGLDKDDPVRAEREDEGVGGMRSDTVMVLRLEPATGAAMLLSFPRDLWVTMGDSSRHDRINAAMSLGGPETLIRTIHNNFDIPIDHYVQVDFAQFKRLVDVIDGVKVYFDRPVRDENTGLDVAEEGCVNLTGDQALAYARSRHFEYYENGRWHEDATADLGRISRQQDFLKRALRRAVAKGLRNPITLNRLVNTGIDAVTVDEQFQVSDMLSLANTFRSFDPDHLETIELPVVGDMIGDASVLRLIDNDAAEAALDRFRGRSATELAPGDVSVRVLNGTGKPGEGRLAGDALRGAAFDVVGIGDADTSTHPRSVIRYATNQLGEAQTLARWVKEMPTFELAPELAGGVIEFVTGNDFGGVRSEPLALADVVAAATTTTAPATTLPSRPQAGGAASGGAAAGGATTSSVTPTPETTTTRYGVVPTGGAADQCR